MTDEEMSELAECMAMACEGKKIRPFFGRDGWSYCPLGALLEHGPVDHGHYPNPHQAGLVLGMTDDEVYGFARGFDGDDSRPRLDLRAYELGVLFREQYAR